jgi:hypothetical protein
MMKGKSFIMNTMAMVAMASAIVACGSDDVFTEADALNNANKVLGIEIPANQDWKMTQDVTANITVNLGKDKEYTLVVFDKSPFDNSDAVYFTKKKVSDASVTKFDLSVPSYLTELYVSVIDENNRSRSKRVFIADDVVDVIFGTAMEGSFSRTRANNPGVDYPATSTGINANANEWADPTPGKEFGGWIVPYPLTDEQKAVVKAYFQAVPNLTYDDPHYRHFFVQQVYKGNTAKAGVSSETIVGANGTVYDSNNMNLLTVGYNEQHINNFNSGNYNYGNTVNVLDSNYTVNEFNDHHHGDQIMLMVNIDDTECFGYHNSGCSLQRNDKAALVGWETIRTWANNNGLNGDCLKDGWNRSFLGFDIALKNLQESYAKDGNGIVYAKLNNIPGNTPQYVWDGQNVIPVKSVARLNDLNITSAFTSFWKESESKVDNPDGTITYKAANWGGICAWFGTTTDFSAYMTSLIVEFAEPTPVATKLVIEKGDANGKWNDIEEYANAGVNQIELVFANKGVDSWTLGHNVRQIALQADGPADIKINRIYFKGQEGVNGYGDYFVFNGKQVPFLDTNTNQYSGEYLTDQNLVINDGNMKININGVECVNLPRFKAAVEAGYLPVKDKDLRDWVKWKDSDGYFSDWIVTLTKANRIDNEEVHEDEPDLNPAVYSYAFEDSWYADYDMNDVVLKVKENKDDATKLDVTLCCTGASYNLKIYLRYPQSDGTHIDVPVFGEQEVHTVLGGTAGLFINTGVGDKFQTLPSRTTTVTKPANYNGIADFWIQSPEKDVHVSTEGEDPHGVIIPGDWRWPKEWTSIKDAYPDFINFAKNPSNPAYAEWYKNNIQEDKLY